MNKHPLRFRSYRSNDCEWLIVTMCKIMLPHTIVDRARTSHRASAVILVFLVLQYFIIFDSKNDAYTEIHLREFTSFMK